MFAADWSAYEVFSIISGLGLLLFALLPSLDLKERALFVAVGAGLIAYAIYVANQTDGIYFFSVWIFILPVIGLGYGVLAAYAWATEKWPDGVSGAVESINRLGKGSSSSGAGYSGLTPPGAPMPGQPPPVPPSGSPAGPGPGPAASAAPTWIASSQAQPAQPAHPNLSPQPPASPYSPAAPPMPPPAPAPASTGRSPFAPPPESPPPAATRDADSAGGDPTPWWVQEPPGVDPPPA